MEILKSIWKHLLLFTITI